MTADLSWPATTQQVSDLDNETVVLGHAIGTKVVSYGLPEWCCKVSGCTEHCQGTCLPHSWKEELPEESCLCKFGDPGYCSHSLALVIFDGGYTWRTNRSMELLKASLIYMSRRQTSSLHWRWSNAFSLVGSSALALGILFGCSPTLFSRFS